MQVANIMEEQNRLNDAYMYVQVANDTYREVYGAQSDNTIIALWLKLQIAYTQSTQKNNTVVDMADSLFAALVQRDTDFIEKYYSTLSKEFELDSSQRDELVYQGYEGVDQLKQEMDKIKVLCIATHIMEMTRMLSNEKKLILESYLDKIMLNKYQQDQEGNQVFLKKLLEYKNKHIDLLSVKKVSSI